MSGKSKSFDSKKLAGIAFYAAAAATIAFFAGKDALANIAASINAPQTYQISQSHPAGSVALAQKLINSSKKGKELADAARFAKASLRTQAINPAALNALGYTLSEGKNANLSSARKIQALAYKTSRRDINVIRWLIADGERTGDLKAILRYYDNGMRLGPDAQEILFPRLNLAMGLPLFHPLFAPYVKNNASWLPNFLGYSLYNSKTSDKVADAIMMAGGLPKNNQKYREIEGSLLGLLTSQGHYATAKKYYLSLDDAKPAILSSLSLTPGNVDPLRSAITWQSVSGAAAGGDFGTSADKGKMVLQTFVLPNENGNVATKLLFLTPGRYNFKAKVDARVAGGSTLAAAKLSCVSGGKVQSIWQGDLLTNQGYDLIPIPPGCSAQSMAIWLSAGEGQNGEEILISELAITPAK